MAAGRPMARFADRNERFLPQVFIVKWVIERASDRSKRQVTFADAAATVFEALVTESTDR